MGITLDLHKLPSQELSYFILLDRNHSTMSNQFLSISKFSAVCTLTIALLLGGASLAKAESRDQSVDTVTDSLFHNVNPELKRRKIRTSESAYIQEWQVIRQVVDRGLRYKKLDPKKNPCEIPDWYFDNKDEAFRDRLADAIFYHRYPAMKGQPIDRSDRTSTGEWLKFKRSMGVAYC
jgi:hypothetical protein